MSYKYTVVYSTDAADMLDKVGLLLEQGWNTDYDPKQIGEVFWCKLFKDEPETAAERNRAYRLSRPLSDLPPVQSSGRGY